MEKSEKITLLSIIVVVGFVLGVFYHYAIAQYFHLNVPPYNSFLYPSFGAFSDIFYILPYTKNFAPYSSISMWTVYFPLTFICMFPFALIKNKIICYLLYISGFLIYFVFMNIKVFYCKNLTKLQNFQNIFILTAISYPFLYILDKGNFDIFLFIILGLFVYAFKTERYLIAAILLALENAMKPFPFLFLLLFLFKKKYKEAFISLALSILLVLGGFLLFKNNLSEQLKYFHQSLLFFKYRYVYLNNTDFGMSYGSSLFMMLKLIFCKSTVVPLVSVKTLAKYYDILSYILTIGTMFFVWKEKIYWKQLTLLICNFLLIPFITYDYKLLFLFLPIWLFVNSAEKTRFDWAYILLFGLLFIPKCFLIVTPHLDSTTFVQWFSISIILNPIIIIVLSLLIIYEQFIKGQKEKE